MTLPAAGTGICGQIWANPQGVWFEFAETRHELFLRTAGRVMTLPYSGRCKGRFFAPLESLSATEQLRNHYKEEWDKSKVTVPGNCGKKRSTSR